MATCRLIILCLTFFLAGSSAAFSECYIWRVVYVVDGDTATVEVLPGVYTRVRFMGYDTPEIRGHCEVEIAMAKQARDYLKELLGSSAQFCVIDKTTLSPPPPPWDKRTYAWVSSGSRQMSTAMVGAGLARFYSGGPRTSWCSGLEKGT